MNDLQIMNVRCICICCNKGEAMYSCVGGVVTLTVALTIAAFVMCRHDNIMVCRLQWR